MPVDTALGIDTKINSLHPAYWLKSFNSNHTISSNNLQVQLWHQLQKAELITVSYPNGK